MMGWIKVKLGLEQSFGQLSRQLLDAAEPLNVSLQDQKKTLRRMSLAQMQQSESLEFIQQGLSSLCRTVEQRDGITVKFADCLEILDQLSKLQLLTKQYQDLELAVRHASQTTYKRLKIEATAELHQAYPAHDCEVVGAVEDRDHQPGTVLDIVQQGYRSQAGNLLRPAKVVVAKPFIREG